MYYSVDGIENGTARLVADDGKIVFAAVSELPCGIAQTDIVVHNGETWTAAPEETLRRKNQAQELMKRILSR